MADRPSSCTPHMQVKAVVVGFDPHISYKKLVKTSSYLGNPDCLFVVSNEDARLPSKGPILIPGTKACSQFVFSFWKLLLLFFWVGKFVVILCTLFSFM